MNIQTIIETLTQVFLLAICITHVAGKPRPVREVDMSGDQEETNKTCGDIQQANLNISTDDLYPNTNTFLMYPFAKPEPEYIQPADEPNCPINEEVSMSAPINLAGTCPYDFVDNINTRRIPVKIKEARCLCKHGLELYDRSERRDTVCQEIMQPMKVLMQDGCVDGYYSYRMEEIQIAVGCLQVRG